MVTAPTDRTPRRDRDSRRRDQSRWAMMTCALIPASNAPRPNRASTPCAAASVASRERGSIARLDLIRSSEALQYATAASRAEAARLRAGTVSICTSPVKPPLVRSRRIASRYRPLLVRQARHRLKQGLQITPMPARSSRRAGCRFSSSQSQRFEDAGVSAWLEHSPRLCMRPHLVRIEHDPELTDHRIEGAVVERQLQCVRPSATRRGGTVPRAAA